MLIVDVEMAGHVKFVISLRHPPSLVVVLVVISVADGLMLVLVFVGCLVVVEVTGGDDRQKLSLKYQHGGEIDQNLQSGVWIISVSWILWLDIAWW